MIRVVTKDYRSDDIKMHALPPTRNLSYIIRSFCLQLSFFFMSWFCWGVCVIITNLANQNLRLSTDTSWVKGSRFAHCAWSWMMVFMQVMLVILRGEGTVQVDIWHSTLSRVQSYHYHYQYQYFTSMVQTWNWKWNSTSTFNIWSFNEHCRATTVWFQKLGSYSSSHF